MKRILVCLALALTLTACTRPALPDEETAEKGPSVELPADQEVADRAVALLKEGKLYEALETAMTVRGSVDAQRVIADVTGAYSHGDRLFTRSVALNGDVKGVETLFRGRAVAETSENIYLLDFDSGEVIRAFEKGQWDTNGQELYILGDRLSCYDGETGAEKWSCEAEGRLFADEIGAVTVNGSVITVYDGTGQVYSRDMGADIVAHCRDEMNRICLFNGQEVHVVNGPEELFEFLPLAVCTGVRGDFYAVCDGFVTNGKWRTEYVVEDGFLEMDGCSVTVYKVGEPVQYADALVIANENRLTVLDCGTGETVFDTRLDAPITYLEADGDHLNVATGRFYTPKGMLTVEADRETGRDRDVFKFGEVYTFGGDVSCAHSRNGRIALWDGNGLQLLKKVSYDGYTALPIDKCFPTAIGDSADGYAIGSYEYIDKVRRNYLIYPIENGEYGRADVDFEIKSIVYSDGWHLFGANGEYTVVDGEPKELTLPEVIVYGREFELGGKTYTASDNRITDGDGNFVEVGFQMNNESQFFTIDERTLYVTEYRYSGRSAVVRLDVMKIQAEPEDGVYYSSARNAILFKANGYGEYKYVG